MMQIAWRWEDLVEEARDADIAINQGYDEQSKWLTGNLGSSEEHMKVIEDVNTLFRSQAERDQFVALGQRSGL